MQAGFPRNIPDHRGLSLKVDVRHTNENDRFCATIGVFSRQSRTIVFRVDRRIFAVGPTGGRLLTSQVAQWFTNTCLLDFAASSPAFDYWTFLHLKVRNWILYFNCSRILGILCPLSFTNSNADKPMEKSVDIGPFFFFIHILISYRLIKI